MVEKRDMLNSIPPYPDLLATLNALAPAALGAASPDATIWQCPSGLPYGQSAQNSQCKQHPLADVQARSTCTFQPARDAKPGSWDRAHCHTRFSKAASLAYHIERGACLQFNGSRAPAQVPHWPTNPASRYPPEWPGGPV